MTFRSIVIFVMLCFSCISAAAEESAKLTTGEISIAPIDFVSSLPIDGRQRFVHGVNELSARYKLDGTGQVIGIWDGGHVAKKHNEFDAARVFINDSTDVVSQHATHVAGILVGKGTFKGVSDGVAPGAILYSHDFTNDISEMKKFAKNMSSTSIVSNHSYGRKAGWTKLCVDNATSPPRLTRVWFGKENEAEDIIFGKYTDRSKSFDQIAFDNPNWTIVTAAGNTRNPLLANVKKRMEAQAFQPNLKWLKKYDLAQATQNFRLKSCFGKKIPSSKAAPPHLLYDTLPGGLGTAKNVLVVGSMNAPIGLWVAAKSRYGNLTKQYIIPDVFSSFGPTDDGRVKPDLVANGSDVISAALPKTCTASNPCLLSDQYKVDLFSKKSGTSMAAPVVTGAIALLQQLNTKLFGTFLYSDQIRGLLTHTAQGEIDGSPNYQIGWGAIRVDNAAWFLEGVKSGDKTMVRMSVNSGDVKELLLVPTQLPEPVRVTTTWLDPAGAVNGSKNERASRLLHNINTRLIDPSGAKYYPWVLNPDQPDNKATQGQNNVDNLERIDVKSSSRHPGNWKLIVDASLLPTGAAQSFSITLSGLRKK